MSQRNRFAWLTGLALTLTGCTGAISGLFGGGASGAPLVTRNPGATRTPTPFAALAPTRTPIPTATSTPGPTASPTPVNPWGDFAGPVEPSAIEIPPPMPPMPFPAGAVNIVLLGSDLRPNLGGWRTDTMLVLSLNPTAGTVTLLSIPRDLYVYIPGFRIDRVNTADVRGGFPMVSATLLYNLGVRVDHWARINFSGFIAGVDALGGIDVQVTGYLYDECGRRYWRYKPGVYHMDGFTALCYVRMRKASSDFDRLRREQEVTLALFTKVLSVNALTRLPEVYDQFSSLVKTDMTVGDLLPLVPLAANVAADRTRIHQYAIGSSLVTSWRVPYSGAAVLLPNRDAIQAMLQNAFPPS